MARGTANKEIMSLNLFFMNCLLASLMDLLRGGRCQEAHSVLVDLIAMQQIHALYPSLGIPELPDGSARPWLRLWHAQHQAGLCHSQLLK